MTVKASGRFSNPLLGSRHAAGGLLEDAPSELIAARNWVTYYNDFNKFSDWGATPAAGSATLDNWTITAIGTMTVGTVAMGADASPATLSAAQISNGHLVLTPDALDNEGYHVQQTNGGPGEIWLPYSGRTILFEARIAAGDWDGQDFFVGLAETSSTLLSAAGALTSDNLVGFHHTIADAGLVDCVAIGTADANEESFGTANSAIWTNADYHTVGFRIDGTNRLKFYVDGVKVREGVMTTAFDDAMCISFGNVGSGATEDTLAIDYVTVAQTRL